MELFEALVMKWRVEDVIHNSQSRVNTDIVMITTTGNTESSDKTTGNKYKVE